MAATMVRCGTWRQLVKVKGALCEDGVRRTVAITSEADTYFSVPGRVQVRGKTVTGFVTGFENDEGERDMKFIAYSNRKNHALLDGQATRLVYTASGPA